MGRGRDMKTTSVIGSILFGAACLACSMTASAQGPGWTTTSTVVELVVTAAGGINVRLSPDLTNCVSQSGYGAIYASIYPNHPGKKEMKADLLVAYLTGARVALYLTDATCTVGEMRLFQQ